RPINAQGYAADRHAVGANRPDERDVHHVLLRLTLGANVHLLNLHADSSRALGNNPTIEGELLGLAGHLCLQISDRSRDLRLLARASYPDGVELRQLRAQFPIGLTQPLDLNLELGTLLCNREPVVT